MIGLKDNVVELSAHDVRWPVMFRAEAELLAGAIGPAAALIEHIGSTSVPGLAAKPVIDIAIQVAHGPDLPLVVACIEKQGYLYKGEFGIAGRHFFTKGNPVVFHLHVVAPGHEQWPRWIGFRDALRSSEPLRNEYEALKHELATRFRGDRAAYTKAKNGFIHRVLGIAAS